MTPTEKWAAAVTDGWVDLAVLSVLAGERPGCGARGCKRVASRVDPSGVGWCEKHRALSIHGDGWGRKP